MRKEELIMNKANFILFIILFAAVTLLCNPPESLLGPVDDFTYKDIQLEGYNPYPAIKAPLTAVGGFGKDKTLKDLRNSG